MKEGGSSYQDEEDEESESMIDELEESVIEFNDSVIVENEHKDNFEENELK